MRIVIDASRSSCALPLFGMTLLERVLRTVLEAGLTPSEVRIRCTEGAASESWLPADLGTRLPLLFEEATGTLAEALGRAASDSAVLAVDGDAVLDPRLLAYVAGHPGTAVRFGDSDGERTALLHLGGAPAAPATGAETLSALAEHWMAAGALREIDPGDVPDYVRKLRRHLPAYAFRVADAAARDAAEERLFWWNYKGSTDFFTRYVYPPFVWRATRFLARRRVHPNWISVFNILITFAAVPLFAMAAWWPAFAMAWSMSVLDSVDGKLARLTFRASPLGNVLDHGLDVVHPPFWYLAWAYALAGGAAGSPILLAAWAMTGAYVLDRLVTEAFKRLSERRIPGGRSIHAWRPLDVRARTFISRRNINLPLFNVGVIVGLAIPAFYVIVAWQVATLGFHAARVVSLWMTPAEPRAAGAGA